MNGDLSLSQALGGLRIANPDDASPSPSREQSVEHQEPEPGSSAAPSLYQQPAHYINADTSRIPSTPADLSRGHEARPRSTTHTFESAAALLKTAQNNLNAARGIPPSADTAESYLSGQDLRQQSPSARALPRSSSSRPQSTSYGRPTSRELDSSGSQFGATRPEPSRSSMYGMMPHSDSRSNLPTSSPIPSRQSSRCNRTGPHVDGPHSALPPRTSSKGMGGGYTPVPGVPMVPGNSSLERDLPPIASNEEWKDKGAAVGIRKEVDADGRTVLKSVKKGVRDFSFGRILGEGSYSTVYLATDRQTLREYAIKVLEKKHIIKEKKIKYVNIEKNTLNRLTEHPGIVRLYYTFQDETSLYYVLDLCNGGELLGVLKKTGTFDLECARFYGAQILDAIDYMHSRGVIHRDLKPENVLLDDQMHVKITDFGTAKLLPDPRNPGPSDVLAQMDGAPTKQAASFVGTAEYVSPELLTDKSAGKPSDLWAFGCIIFQLLSGRPPFKANTEYLTFQKIVNLEYNFPPGFPSSARDLVERCLVLDPARRLTVEHIKNHEFFDGHKIGKELWKAKAPRLKPYSPTHEIMMHHQRPSAPPPAPIASTRAPQVPANGARPARIITELPPPTQLDIEWSPVLTRTNERILKLGDLMVTSAPVSNSPNARGEYGDGHKKLSRFFGGSTTKKRQRLVMVTSSGRVVLAPAGGEEKRAKHDVSLLAADCTWRSQLDAKGQLVWCIDTSGMRYTFEEAKPTSTEANRYLVEDWMEALERAKDLGMAQNGSYGSDNGFGESSSMSSPASTLGGRTNYDNYAEGFGINDRSGRSQPNRSQASLEDPNNSTSNQNAKRNRFSKRQSKNGLGAQF